LPVAASSRADGRTLTLRFIDAPRRFADDRARKSSKLAQPSPGYEEVPGRLPGGVDSEESV